MEPVKIRGPVRLPVPPPTQRLRRSVFNIREDVSVKGIFKWIGARFKEGSSYASLAAAAIVFGAPPEGVDLVTQAIIGVVAAVGFFLKDKPE